MLSIKSSQLCVCVCVCVCEGEREGERECMDPSIWRCVWLVDENQEHDDTRHYSDDDPIMCSYMSCFVCLYFSHTIVSRNV